MTSQKTVYVDGVFDLLHVGHLNFLKEAKKLGDKLVVGIVLDEDALSYKRQPIIPYQQRYEMIDNLKCVDVTIPAVLHLTKEFIVNNHIDVVVHGDDDEQIEFFKVPREMGIMKYIPYFRATSTTSIINKILETESK